MAERFCFVVEGTAETTEELTPIVDALRAALADRGVTVTLNVRDAAERVLAAQAPRGGG